MVSGESTGYDPGIEEWMAMDLTRMTVVVRWDAMVMAVNGLHMHEL